MAREEKLLLSLCQDLCNNKEAISQQLGNQSPNLSFDKTGLTFYTKQDYGHPQDGNLWFLNFNNGAITIEHDYGYLDEEGDHSILHQKLSVTSEDTNLENIDCENCEYSSASEMMSSMMKEMESFINNNGLKPFLKISSSSFFPSEDKKIGAPDGPSVGNVKGY